MSETSMDMLLDTSPLGSEPSGLISLAINGLFDSPLMLVKLWEGFGAGIKETALIHFFFIQVSSSVCNMMSYITSKTPLETYPDTTVA